MKWKGQNKWEGRGGRGGGGGGQNFKISVNIGNEWKKRHEYLILMLNLKVSNKQEVKLVRTR